MLIEEEIFLNRGIYLMIPALCLAASLMITACHTKAELPMETDITVTATESEAQPGKTITRPASPTAVQEQALRDRLEAEADGEIAQFICGDFEAAGSYQAFAIIGEATKEDQQIFDGSVWFVSDSEVKKISEENSCSLLTERPVGAQTLVTTYRFFGMGSITSIYGVRDGDVYEDPISGQVTGLNQLDDETFTVIQDTYDASLDGTGHTWKNYWLYWDNGFHEFGGIEISLSDLKKLDGSAKVLDQIDKVKGRIINILYRKNQIININYRTPWMGESDDDYLNNYFVNLKYDNGKVTVLPADDNRGMYLEALLPSIARYPKAFPES